MKLQPIGPRLLIKQDEKKEKTIGGIILPETKDDAPRSGAVVSVGGKCDYDFRVGQRVFFRIYAPDEIEIDGTEYLVCDEVDILAAIEDE